MAISTPTTPPPSTSSEPGIGSAVVASRLVHGWASASPGIGGTAAAVPGARTTALASPQQILADAHRPLALKRAVAAYQRDPRSRSHGSCAAVVEVVNDLIAAAQNRLDV